MPCASPSNVAPNGFAGIYMAELILPARCWGEEGEKVYFHSEHGSFVDVVCVDTVTKEVQYLTGHQEQEQQGTFAVLDVAEGFLLVKYSSLSTAPQLVGSCLFLLLLLLYSSSSMSFSSSSFCSFSCSSLYSFYFYHLLPLV